MDEVLKREVENQLWLQRKTLRPEHPIRDLIILNEAIRRGKKIEKLTLSL